MNDPIPQFIPWRLRKYYRSIANCWRDPLIPPESLHDIGSPDVETFIAVGNDFFRYFLELCNLPAHARVLDVGCGTGRMARPLTKYLKAGGSYDGMDIVAPSIQWCNKTYHSRYPNFNFHFSDLYNKSYNPNGKYNASEYRFPFENASFDFVFLASVFTHMLPHDLDNYLSEIARVLAPKGRCLITYFLFNQESSKLIANGVSHFSFKYELPGCRVEFSETPEAVVGYSESAIRNLYGKYGLTVSQPILYGNWCARQIYTSWQDMIIATKG